MLAAGDIAQLVQQGVAIVIGTRDADLRPAVSRAWGPELSGDGATLMLCVEAPPGSPTERNLRDGSPLAATFSLPSSYATAQLKGVVTAIEPPSPDRLAAVGRHADAFVTETSKVGMSPPLARRTVGTEFLTVVVAVAERYDQTPGEGAGRAL